VVLLRGESILNRANLPLRGDERKVWFSGPTIMETLTFDDASKMTSEALFEQGWNSRVMPHGGRREGARRPRGSGNGPTVETHSVSLPPKTWQLIDEMRGSSSRGVFISVCVYRQISARLTTTDVWQASQASHQQSLPPNTL
jgi:hypothetical protein